MAVGATSLRFQVEIAADKATEGLRAIQVAANQAGVSIRTSLQGVGGIARRSANDFQEFRRTLSQGRATAMVFARALGEVAPAGSAAQSAIIGVGGAILGGGGLLFALEAIRFGIRYFSDLEEGTRKAREEAEKLAKAIRDDLTRAQREAAALEYARRGGRAEDFNAEMSALTQSLALVQQKEAETEKLRNVQREIAELQRQEFLINPTAYAADLAALEAREAQLKDNLRALSETGRLIRDNRDLETGIERDTEQRKRNAETIKAQNRALEEQRRVGQAALDARARAYEKQRIEPNLSGLPSTAGFMEIESAALSTAANIKDGWTNAAQVIGTTFGGTFASMVSGAMSVSAAVSQMIGNMLSIVLQAAVTRITAAAPVAGAEAAASQAGVPIVGPALAVAAMSAMIATVMGLLSNLPGRAMGGPVRPGQPYIVGELGPEVMVPGRSGSIVPNNALGATEVHFHGFLIDGPGVERAFRRLGRHAGRGLRASARNRRA